MSKTIQSIEDLLDSSIPVKSDDESVVGKFKQKEEDMKKKDIERLTNQKADNAGLAYINLIGFPISPEALSIIHEDESKSLKCVCFYYDGAQLRIGAIDKTDEVAALAEFLGENYHVDVKVYLISAYSLEYALYMYKSLPKIREFVRGVKITEDDLNKYSDRFTSFNDLQQQLNEASVSEMIIMLLAASIKSESSDIHIEGEEMLIKVRFRVDGVLHDVASIDKKMWPKIISRLKLLAGVKINITDKPQDGRVSIFLKSDRVDIRCSFLPTAYGESVVMRLLRASTVGLNFEDLGLSGKAHERLKREVERPNGMIVTTGPTGSGKTTTLYAVLKKLNSPETKIITIEDPIEYQLTGVNQSQTTEKYTFAQALRSIVRQDPDIIMVGEIRDLETAEIAIQASLTGHLVLSTIHTNDASGTIPRFLSMGAKPYLIAPSINAMIGQRLVRKICHGCKEEIKLEEAEMTRVKGIFETLPDEEKKNIQEKEMKFYKGKGCKTCQGIGFKGRIGIYEIMTMNAEVEKLILSGNVSEYDMLENGRKNGMVTMVQDGLLKALDGVTSVDEVFRVAE